MIDINDIAIGKVLTFTDHEPGAVISIMDQVKIGPNSALWAQVRLEIKHEHSTTYHWFRNDGRSTYEPGMDIVDIT